MEEKEKASAENNALYYGIGAAVLVLLIAGVYLLRPKAPTQPSTQSSLQTGGTGAPLVRPTGPITGLACEIQYYNPVVGRKEYYLSAEGSDLTEAKNVTCTFSATVAGKQVAKATVEDVKLIDEPNRDGKIFRCITEGVALEPQVPTVIDVQITDDLKKSTTCSATFLFPQP